MQTCPSWTEGTCSAIPEKQVIFSIHSLNTHSTARNRSFPAYCTFTPPHAHSPSPSALPSTGLKAIMCDFLFCPLLFVHDQAGLWPLNRKLRRAFVVTCFGVHFPPLLYLLTSLGLKKKKIFRDTFRTVTARLQPA